MHRHVLKINKFLEHERAPWVPEGFFEIAYARVGACPSFVCIVQGTEVVLGS